MRPLRVDPRPQRGGIAPARREFGSALALRRRLPLATADKALLAAMRASGVDRAAFVAR